MSLFVTHGGMNSLLEASKFGVPMLDIPLFGDQPRNAKVVEELKLGRYISKFDFDGNYDKLKEVFDDLMNNKIYSETAKRTSLMIANRPYNPRDLFIKYIEFAAQFGRIDHFTIPNSDLPLWKYLYLDFISLLIGVILMVVFIVKKTINVVKKSICKGKKNHKTD
uniref:glucuronosyltransferase n=1 Tax=Strongyloides papillosus TaxID=174720 RepID=A0A0N5BKW7_STREA